MKLAKSQCFLPKQQQMLQQSNYDVGWQKPCSSHTRKGHVYTHVYIEERTFGLNNI